ncbi:MAG: protein-glutamate methylesterase/protein-glutamine glutaminase [Eubacteriales bacterium]|jgi:two-component system chemotaxis response regulator CheB|nr:chemotaxis response regulator protein-glutamate methylesterase [Clostridiales bacterium]
MKKKIKVLIVDDSVLFREILARYLAEDPRIEVVAKAADPYEARDMIIKYRPDVMTCDIEMPKMNGIEFVKRLIPQYPMPVIIISSVSGVVFDAMRAGAVDFVPKPSDRSPDGIHNFARELVSKIIAAAGAKVRGGRLHPANAFAAVGKTAERQFDHKKVIAIGSSAGGIEALNEILKSLPPTIPGILVVQHIPPVFSRMFAERMDRETALNVVEAKTGELILPGKVLIAPGDKHMRVRKIGSRYVTEVFGDERVNGHCPSVDVLFSSVAKVYGANAVGVILTGMGRDGAEGLLEMKNQGATTIGQDEKTSVVYGMPKVAFEIGAVEKQYPIYEIADAIMAAVKI